MHKRPHICFIALSAYPLLANKTDIQVIGGAELQQVIIAKGLVARGYRVSMICLDFGQEDRIEIDGIVVHRAFHPRKELPGVRFLWPRLTSIWSCLTRIDADIYYQRAAGMLTGAMAAFCKRNKKMSVFAVAGEPMIRFRRDRWIYEYGIRRVDCVVVQNENQQRYVQENFARDSIIVPNCYQIDNPQPSETSKQILWVSTIRQLKRPELFIEIARALPNYRFSMVGGVASDDPSLYDEIKARAQELQNLEFVGFVPYVHIDRYFDDAAIFINTSDSEGFPNTFLQAWARGIPTVSFVDSGARADERPIGCIVNSIGEMISAVENLSENDQERFRIGAQCKLYMEKNHALNRVLDLYENIFLGAR